MRNEVESWGSTEAAWPAVLALMAAVLAVMAVVLVVLAMLATRAAGARAAWVKPACSGCSRNRSRCRRGSNRCRCRWSKKRHKHHSNGHSQARRSCWDQCLTCSIPTGKTSRERRLQTDTRSLW